VTDFCVHDDELSGFILDELGDCYIFKHKSDRAARFTSRLDTDYPE
jgi:hypothetical protein